jgi:hypothetical protein
MTKKTTPDLPVATTTYVKMTEDERALWHLLREAKESKDDKPSGDSNGILFCDSVAKYLNLAATIKALEEEKKKVSEFLYTRMVARQLGVVECPEGRVSLSAFTKEVSDSAYLKEKCPEAFVVVPDRLQVRVDPPK